MPRIVALITDFGTSDHYAGAMKGAVLAACPDATVVDITHDLPAQGVGEAAFCVAASFRTFPGGSVFVVAVDPGVGSSRRGLAVEAGGYRFVGPDNGVFTLVLDELPDPTVHAITNSGLFRYEVSPTFHGRDVFAPVAGYLALGGSIADVGPAISDPMTLPLGRVERVSEDEWEGVVLHTDRFVNLTTNLGGSALETIMATVGGDPTAIVVLVEGFVLPLVSTYADVPEAEACALVGSSARLEVAVNRGSAAQLLGATSGTPVRVRTVSAREVTL